MIRRVVVMNAALAGAADTLLFLARRPHLFRQAPGRAFGSVGFLAAWGALALEGARSTQAARRSVTMPALAGALLAANAGMLAVHLRHRVAGPRVFLGTALSAVALGASIPV